MPKETIATRTETDTAPDGRVLETRRDILCVAWGRQPGASSDGVQITIRQETDLTARELYSAALTQAEISDLIRVLKRAERQAYPHRAPCVDGNVCGGPHCPPADPRVVH